jgi:hypothetical protein
MPFAAELVVSGEVIVLQVVVGILAVVDAVRLSVKIVVVALCRIVQAKDAGGFGVLGPQRNIMPAWQAELNDPLLARLERGVDPCIGERIDGVEQRVRHVVVVRRQLRFDPGNREESADSDVN